MATGLATTNQDTRIADPKKEDPTLKKARALAARLKYMIVNGQNLTDREVFALSQYSAANDLNPFAGECFYMPNVGPIPGIVGWRKKAQEQLDFEAARENTQAHFWTEDRAATTQEVKHNPEAGDIAVIVTLHDWLSNTRWRKAFFETIRELKGLGYDQKEATETAKAMVGPEPVWTGIGIVFASEIFAKDGKAEKMSRYERAQKRAEKIALRKRFPRVNLPEPVGGADEDVIDVSFKDSEQQPTNAERQAQIINELYSDAPAIATTSEPASEGDWKDIPEDEQPAPMVDEALGNDEMSTQAPAQNLPPLRLQPAALKEALARKAVALINPEVTPAQKGLIATTMEATLSFTTNPKESRQQALQYLTGHAHLTELDSKVLSALYSWLKPYKDPNGSGEWFADEMAARELVAAFNAAQPDQPSLI